MSSRRTYSVYLIFAFIVILIAGISTNSIAYSNSKGTENNTTTTEPDRDTIRINSSETSIVVDSVMNLNGNCLLIPFGKKLVFKEGKICNGVVIGQETQLFGEKNIFENVTISGKWNVPEISSDMFCDLRGTNSLKNVFALACADKYNKIIIKDGVYSVYATDKEPNILKVPSNTDLIIDGIIKLEPNTLEHYSIIDIYKAHNIIIEGKGHIIGDRLNHLGTDGEWGMCIQMKYVDNIKIANLKISYAWGDCIYIGKGSNCVEVTGCNLDHSRRQGISVIEGKEINIHHCNISNIYGANPQYGIDIEPNRNDSVKKVTISNIKITNSGGGIKSFASTNKKSVIEAILIKNCSISSCRERSPLRFIGAYSLKIDSCFIEKSPTPSILLSNINSASIKNITSDTRGKDFINRKKVISLKIE